MRTKRRGVLLLQIVWLLLSQGGASELYNPEAAKFTLPLEKNLLCPGIPQDGVLLFQQVPMVEIDGMKMVQSRAILNYIAAKHNLYGKDLKERALIDMYCEATMDLNEIIMMIPFKPADTREKEEELVFERATTRYFPVFEKVLKDHGQNFLVGNVMSRADIQLLETILMVEEVKAGTVSKFPLLKFEEQLISSKEELEKLRQDGVLLFQQMPMVEIDGMKLVQTRAILNYIAAKYNLYGKDLKERALYRTISGINMYCEATMDLNEIIMVLAFKTADVREKDEALILERASTRYFPVFEKVLKDHGQNFLIGNMLSRADIQVLETMLMVEEIKADSLSKFPLLQALKARMSNIPPIKKFLQPGSPRKPPTDANTAAEAIKIFNCAS
ncbi:hypothetical protein lerEdw1_001372 [Lerista edwardsae]|nr:hypothetical protein lerEdw1_001372 [Lerista edwardsae]